MASTNKTVSADVLVTGTLDMRQYEILNLNTDLAQYPTEADQGASKLYVDTVRDGIVANLPTEVNNGTY